MTPKTRTSRSRFIAGATRVSSRQETQGLPIAQGVVPFHPTVFLIAVVGERPFGRSSGRIGGSIEGRLLFPTPTGSANSDVDLDIGLAFSNGASYRQAVEAHPDSVHENLPRHQLAWTPSWGWTATPLRIFPEQVGNDREEPEENDRMLMRPVSREEGVRIGHPHTQVVWRACAILLGASEGGNGESDTPAGCDNERAASNELP